MDTVIRISCLPIGKAWPVKALGLFRSLVQNLPERMQLSIQKPVIREPEILQQLDNLRNSNTTLILLPALHGGSARSLTLAGSRLNIPTAILCCNQDFSLSSSSIAAAALDRIGHPHVLINAESPSAISELQAAAEAASARNLLSKTRIGKLGPLHFNLISAEISPITLYARFGTWVVPISIASVRERLKRIEAGKMKEMFSIFQHSYTLNADEKILVQGLKLHMILKEIAAEEQLDIMAIDCWNEFLPEFHISPCLGFAENAYRIACEGDLTMAIVMIAGEAMSGKPGYGGDFYSFNEKAGKAVLMHCGGCASLHSGRGKMEITAQRPPKTFDQRDAILSCRPSLHSGIGTLVALHGEELDQLKLRTCHITGIDFRNQMQLKIRISGDSREFRLQSAGNHYVVFLGDHQESWNLWAKWSRIRVH